MSVSAESSPYAGYRDNESFIGYRDGEMVTDEDIEKMVQRYNRKHPEGTIDIGVLYPTRSSEIFRRSKDVIRKAGNAALRGLSASSGVASDAAVRSESITRFAHTQRIV